MTQNNLFCNAVLLIDAESSIDWRPSVVLINKFTLSFKSASTIWGLPSVTLLIIWASYPSFLIESAVPLVAIKENPCSLEIRLLRYSIQKKLPKLLLYFNEIEEDYNFIIKNINTIKDEKTKEFIIQSLKALNKWI